VCRAQAQEGCLRRLVVAMAPVAQILILADERHEDSVTNCDSRSLATLLLIRDIQVRCTWTPRQPPAGAPLIPRLGSLQTCALQSPCSPPVATGYGLRVTG